MDLFFGTGRASAMKEGRAEAERREGEESNFTDISFTIERCVCPVSERVRKEGGGWNAFFAEERGEEVSTVAAGE